LLESCEGKGERESVLSGQRKKEKKIKRKERRMQVSTDTILEALEDFPG